MTRAKSKADLITDADSFLPDNITEKIKPGDVRDRVKDLASSFLNIIDGGNVVTQLTGYASALTPSDDKHFANKKYVDDAIDGLATGLTYQGVWNATTNTPALFSGVGTNGYYYIVDVAGSTNLDGVTDWQIGDWAIFNGSAWQKIDQSPNWADGYGTYDLRYLQLTGGTLSGSLTATSFVKSGGLSTEFLKADGSVDSNTYLTSASLSAYAKLDGTNQPFTGNVKITKTSGETFRTEITAGNNNMYFTSTANVVSDYISPSAFYIRNWTDFVGGNQTFELGSGNIGTSLRASGTRSMIVGNTPHFTSWGNGSINNQCTTLFRMQNISGSKIFDWGATTGTFVMTGALGALNSATFDGGIKIGNNSQTASSAGAGSIRYNSGLEVSDGATWESVGGGTTDFAKETYSMQDITTGTALGGTAYYMKIVMSADCTINRIGCFVTSTAAETIYMAVYNTAGTKLVEGNVASGSVVAGINVATIADTALQAGTEYWIAVKDNNSGSVNLGTKTTLTDTNLCQSEFVGAGSLPGTKGGTSAGTSVYCYVAKV